MNFLAILEAIKAIPKILEYLEKFGMALKKIDLDRDFKAIEEATNELENAKTLKDKLSAGRKFIDVYKRL